MYQNKIYVHSYQNTQYNIEVQTLLKIHCLHLTLPGSIFWKPKCNIRLFDDIRGLTFNCLANRRMRTWCKLWSTTGMDFIQNNTNTNKENLVVQNNFSIEICISYARTTLPKKMFPSWKPPDRYAYSFFIVSVGIVEFVLKLHSYYIDFPGRISTFTVRIRYNAHVNSKSMETIEFSVIQFHLTLYLPTDNRIGGFTPTNLNTAHNRLILSYYWVTRKTLIRLIWSYITSWSIYRIPWFVDATGKSLA